MKWLKRVACGLAPSLIAFGFGYGAQHYLKFMNAEAKIGMPIGGHVALFAAMTVAAIGAIILIVSARWSD